MKCGKSNLDVGTSLVPLAGNLPDGYRRIVHGPTKGSFTTRPLFTSRKLCSCFRRDPEKLDFIFRDVNNYGGVVNYSFVKLCMSVRVSVLVMPESEFRLSSFSLSVLSACSGPCGWPWETRQHLRNFELSVETSEENIVTNILYFVNCEPHDKPLKTLLP